MYTFVPCEFSGTVRNVCEVRLSIFELRIVEFMIENLCITVFALRIVAIKSIKDFFVCR